MKYLILVLTLFSAMSINAQGLLYVFDSWTDVNTYNEKPTVVFVNAEKVCVINEEVDVALCDRVEKMIHTEMEFHADNDGVLDKNTTVTVKTDVVDYKIVYLNGKLENIHFTSGLGEDIWLQNPRTVREVEWTPHISYRKGDVAIQIVYPTKNANLK